MINFQPYQPNNYGCRFMHIFIVDCRFAYLIVDVDFCQKAIVDCRQKGPKSCDQHLIRTPTLVDFFFKVPLKPVPYLYKKAAL